MRTKDRPLLLERAIKDVIAQKYPAWFLVIVNDGGNGKPVDGLVKRYKAGLEGRCKVIHNSVSLGMEAASNKGIRAVRGEYVVIHDDDDSWNPDFLLRTVGYLEEHVDAMGVITHSMQIDERIETDRIVTVREKVFKPWLLGRISYISMLDDNQFPPISFVYRRKVFKEIGFYDENLPVQGDWEFNLRFIRKHDIFIIPESLANYHLRVETSTGIYGNTILTNDGQQRHSLYHIGIQNELLRKDFDSGKAGFGEMIHVSGLVGQYMWRIQEIQWKVNLLEERSRIREERYRLLEERCRTLDRIDRILTAIRNFFPVRLLLWFRRKLRRLSGRK